MDELDEIVDEFLVESFESLDDVDGELVALEAAPENDAAVASIFRAIHSIKGAAGFLEFGSLEAIAHAGENVLDALRSRDIAVEATVITSLLQLNDALRSTLKLIESTGTDEGAEGLEELSMRLKGLLESGAGGSLPVEAAPDPVSPPAAPEPTVAAAGGAPGLESTPHPSVATHSPTEPPTPDRVAPSSAPGHAPAEGHIRVRVEQLDALMNLAGELVLARNQVLQSAAALGDSVVSAATARLSRITTELQEGIMEIRMQPMGLLWSKFPRIVRDLAQQLGKEVDLEVRGSETELDKTLLEAIKDPMTHLVRNALDHGIELPSERETRGKGRVARLELSASHESGEVHILVQDDGRGIDPEIIRRLGVERGLITPNEASQLDDRGAIELLFAPGFSTAQSVTNVSGRGVGMDVVRSNLARVGGSVEIESAVGEGTRVLVRIPLTLAIIPVLTVRADGQRYAIPQVNLLELVRVGEGTGHRVETLQGSAVLRLRGRLLPLVHLAEELGVSQASHTGAQSVVVVHASGRSFGLIVDGIEETEEIVVKPLHQGVKALSVYAGTTILSDGRVALILDVAGLGQRAHLVDEDSLLAKSMQDDAHEEAPSAEDYIIFRAAEGRRMAMPLAVVDRLEDIAPGRVRRAGTQRVVQHGDSILPLLDLSDRLAQDLATMDLEVPLKTIVRTEGGGTVGVVVEDVIDIAQLDPDTPRQASVSPGVAELVVLDGEVTETLDPGWVGDALAARAPARAAASGASMGSDEVVEHQLCTFRIGGTLYGVDVLDVQEVLPPQDRTPVPLAPPEIAGIINLRGETVTLLGLGPRLAGSDPAPADESMIVVLRAEGHIVSLLVDEVGEVCTAPAADFEPCPPFVAAATRELTRNVLKLPGELLLQLHVPSVASAACCPGTVYSNTQSCSPA